MRRGRGTWTLLACGAALGGVVMACSSFGTEVRPEPPDAGQDVATDAPAACTLEYVDNPAATPNAACGPGGARVDLSSDASHCGACGHACSDSGCADGVCESVKVSTPGALSIAKVRGGVAFYVAQDRRVGSLTVSTGAAAPPFANRPLAAQIRRIDFDDTAVYVSTTTEQLRYARATGNSETLPLDTTLLDGVVALGDKSYFYASAAGVERHNKAPPDNRSTRPGNALTVVADGEQAFWLVRTATEVEVRGPFEDGNVLTTAKSASVAALDAKHVYFADLDAQQIRRVPRAGGNSERVAKEVGAVGDMVVDGDFIYWTADRGNIEGSVVMRVSTCGGLPLALAKGLNQLTQLSVEGAYLYVVNGIGTKGDLLRIAK